MSTAFVGKTFLIRSIGTEELAELTVFGTGRTTIDELLISVERGQLAASLFKRPSEKLRSVLDQETVF